MSENLDHACMIRVLRRLEVQGSPCPSFPCPNLYRLQLTVPVMLVLACRCSHRDGCPDIVELSPVDSNARLEALSTGSMMFQLLKSSRRSASTSKARCLMVRCWHIQVMARAINLPRTRKYKMKRKLKEGCETTSTRKVPSHLKSASSARTGTRGRKTEVDDLLENADDRAKMGPRSSRRKHRRQTGGV